MENSISENISDDSEIQDDDDEEDVEEDKQDEELKGVHGFLLQKQKGK